MWMLNFELGSVEVEVEIWSVYLVLSLCCVQQQNITYSLIKDYRCQIQWNENFKLTLMTRHYHNLELRIYALNSHILTHSNLMVMMMKSFAVAYIYSVWYFRHSRFQIENLLNSDFWLKSSLTFDLSREIDE